MGAEPIQGRVFGEIAEEYDRVRPGYPAALVTDVLEYAALGGAPAIEVGPGTGKATAAFAARGVAITAVEPDPAMAAVLARRVADLPNVAITVGAFEDYAPDRAFGLLFSAQAWHWIDPAVRWQRAASAVSPAGAIALFWNNDRPAEPAEAAQILALHHRYAPAIVSDSEPMDESALTESWPYTDLVELQEFGDLSARLYRSRRRLSTADYITLLATQSSYRMLDDASRAELFAALRSALRGQVDLDVRTALYLARRRH
jgi:SAM-dependent methyltransferase